MSAGLAVPSPEQKEIYSSKINQAEFDDVSTWIAEVLDGQMCSQFTYIFDGQELIARGGQRLGEVFDKAVNDAETKSENDPRYLFELRRRKTERQEYDEMIKMATGQSEYNTVVVVSDFPEEVEILGNDFGGYNVSRKQTMLRIITKNPDETITVISQSLDLSNRYALENIYKYLGKEVRSGELLGQRIYLNEPQDMQKSLTDELVSVYDSSLTLQFGGSWYAGRRGSDRRNMLDYACQQSDLISVFLAGPQDDNARYNLSAMVEARFQGRAKPSIIRLANSCDSIGYIQAQMNHFGILARSEGRVYSGCGASLNSQLELSMLGYGDTDKMQDGLSEDKYGSLTFSCKNGHSNRRPHGKLLDKCSTCKVSVKC